MGSVSRYGIRSFTADVLNEVSSDQKVRFHQKAETGVSYASSVACWLHLKRDSLSNTDCNLISFHKISSKVPKKLKRKESAGLKDSGLAFFSNK